MIVDPTVLYSLMLIGYDPSPISHPISMGLCHVRWPHVWTVLVLRRTESVEDGVMS